LVRRHPRCPPRFFHFGCSVMRDDLSAHRHNIHIY
jgi:hypothetical protein